MQYYNVLHSLFQSNTDANGHLSLLMFYLPDTYFILREYGLQIFVWFALVFAIIHSIFIFRAVATLFFIWAGEQAIDQVSSGLFTYW